MNFVLVKRKSAIGVVEDNRRGGTVGRSPRVGTAGSLEDHIRHVLAAQAFRTLLAKNPFDGVDDVGFTRTVRADNDGNTRRKFESRFVSKALEACQLQRF